ncbi:MAG: RluA family pseudouridine synthase [Vampirovibrionia bacterium]
MTNNEPKQINITIEPDDSGQRLDIYLSEILESFSRSRIQKLITDEMVTINNKKTKSSYKLRVNDVLQYSIPDDQPVNIEPENIPLEFVYEDDFLAIINKPADMLTHPAPGKYTGTLVNALLYHCKDSLSGINGYLRPGIIHRLDKDTTGLILVAKNDFAHKSLAKQLQDRTIDKYYLAVTAGNIKEDTGIINEPIARHPVKREKMAVIPDGREAITEWRVLERLKIATLVEAKLITGRTHQIRVHLSHIKHPILGDTVYSNAKPAKINLQGQALQAYKISFNHPENNERLTFKIDFNSDIKKILKTYNSEYIKGERTL